MFFVTACGVGASCNWGHNANGQQKVRAAIKGDHVGM
jgi:hypothetical protein